MSYSKRKLLNRNNSGATSQNYFATLRRLLKPNFECSSLRYSILIFLFHFDNLLFYILQICIEGGIPEVIYGVLRLHHEALHLQHLWSINAYILSVLSYTLYSSLSWSLSIGYNLSRSHSYRNEWNMGWRWREKRQKDMDMIVMSVKVSYECLFILC